jgi:hypothetical protein
MWVLPSIPGWSTSIASFSILAINRQISAVKTVSGKPDQLHDAYSSSADISRCSNCAPAVLIEADPNLFAARPPARQVVYKPVAHSN